MQTSSFCRKRRCRWYTKRHFGYKIKATDVGDNRFGGVAVLYEESKLYKVEEAKARGPNVMTFEVFTGSKHYFVVGGYIPPSDPRGRRSISSTGR